MRVLVTGGAGFIGSTLARACLAAGDRVRVLDDFSTGRAANLEGIRDEIELGRGSVVDPGVVVRAVEGCEVVFHLAARPSVQCSLEDPVGTHTVNVGGTVQVLDAARRARVRRVIFASSCALYGDPGVLPLHEGLPPDPRSPYALHKLAGELHCRQFTRIYGLETVSLRDFNVFGPRQDPGSPYAAVVPLFLAAALASEPPTVHGDGLQSRDFVHVEDVAAATRAAALAPGRVAGEVLNVGSGCRVSLRDLLEAVGAAAARPDLRPVFGPPRRGEVRESQADISRARRLLGWRPARTLEEGLRQTAAALREGEGR